MDDAHFMTRAMANAASARLTVSPRPWVGAVVVTQDGSVAGDGATEGREGPHAEVVALRAAGERARGSTLYVTLEPCSHHGATPPCTDAVVAAGIRRVVAALEDPDRRVAGSGLARLRAAGIEVEVGTGGEEAARQLAPYLKHRRTGRPFVVLKLAASLDGRTAAPDGSSRWITGPEARRDVHRLRRESDAVLVGAGTVKADDPELTVRLGGPEGAQPLRVVLGDIPAGARVEPAISMKGELGGVLDDLGGRGVLQLLVEGGARVAHDFHRLGLVDRYSIYLAPAFFGGDDARPLFAGAGVPTISGLWRGRLAGVTRLGDDLRVDLEPLPGGDPLDDPLGEPGGGQTGNRQISDLPTESDR